MHNTSGAPVELKRNSVIAQVREPDQRVVAVWTVHALDREDEQGIEAEVEYIAEQEKDTIDEFSRQKISEQPPYLHPFVHHTH